ncbi:hypothetical protein POM88_036974 [Heracleum sosnowskyi]|uniref:TF-B3 domain-containing protein n=1 Tax=Heracleum sosnowskyi TaxID=360622 RepID=A0AAD8HP99_9APIA|nr:hypothetical protein POM88_036974 [Heracleum sosnowskyi]
MCYYDIKPYHMIVLHYRGCSEFGLEIFNTYAVEIDYGSTVIPFEKGRCFRNHLGLLVDSVWPCSDIEEDKLHCSLLYNAYSTWSAAYELLISEMHLAGTVYTEILTKHVWSEIGLEETMNWIEMGYKKRKWRIKLKWENGILLFNEEWNSFVEESNLVPGDTCLFLYTAESQVFEIVVFEKFRMGVYNRKGLEHEKGHMKWFKIMNSETLLTGELELPKVFVKELGWMVCNDIHLYLPDGYEFGGFICGGSNLMIELKNILEKYEVHEDYVIFFEFVGRSSFYVTIYNSYGMNIFNHLPEKFLLKDLISKFEREVIVLSDSSMEVSNGMEVEQQTEATTQTNNIIIPPSQIGSVENSFIVVLKPSHVDQQGHGVKLEKLYNGDIDLWWKVMEGCSKSSQEGLSFWKRMGYIHQTG